MTPSENVQLATLKNELLEEIAGLRTEMAPALSFYRDVAAVVGFAKWGIGIGASLVTIAGGLRVLGII